MSDAAAGEGARLGAVLARLAEVIRSRRAADPDRSYSARLLGDPRLAAKKLGEEAVEAALAGAAGDAGALAAEAADVAYHLLVLLEAVGVPLDRVAEVLEAREGTSGLEEKARRGAPPAA